MGKRSRRKRPRTSTPPDQTEVLGPLRVTVDFGEGRRCWINVDAVLDSPLSSELAGLDPTVAGLDSPETRHWVVDRYDGSLDDVGVTAVAEVIARAADPHIAEIDPDRVGDMFRMSELTEVQRAAILAELDAEPWLPRDGPYHVIADRVVSRLLTQPWLSWRAALILDTIHTLFDGGEWTLTPSDTGYYNFETVFETELELLHLIWTPRH